jgi:DNA-binding NarL/FixJ family response regulator
MPINRSTRWTHDEEDRLLELDQAGDPPRIIALKLQRSERAVALRLANLKKATRVRHRSAWH